MLKTTALCVVLAVSFSGALYAQPQQGDYYCSQLKDKIDGAPGTFSDLETIYKQVCKNHRPSAARVDGPLPNCLGREEILAMKQARQEWSAKEQSVLPAGPMKTAELEIQFMGMDVVNVSPANRAIQCSTMMTSVFKQGAQILGSTVTRNMTFTVQFDASGRLVARQAQ